MPSEHRLQRLQRYVLLAHLQPLQRPVTHAQLAREFHIPRWIGRSRTPAFFMLFDSSGADSLPETVDLGFASDSRAQLDEFRRRHRTGLLTLLFTDIVGSTRVKQTLGDSAGVALIQQHHASFRQLLSQFTDAQVIDTAGDSFFVLFARPSEGVLLALRWQAKLRAFARSNPACLFDRIGIHIGEVIVEQGDGASKRLFGAQVDTCARIMSLAGADQILLSRSAFDNARQALKGNEVGELGELVWLNHGAYLLQGLDEPLEICEVGESGLAHLKPPADGDKARRQISREAEAVLGWRPAVGQQVPNTRWVLEQKLGEGGFGEVWLGRNTTTKERRVFKFCFQAERVRFLKRELTLFRLLKERVGDHPHIVRLHDVYLENAPYYVEMDYVDGADLRTWCEAQGGALHVPQPTRLEIVAQAADAVQAAHDAGIIHRDIKPANILIAEGGTRSGDYGRSEQAQTDGKSTIQNPKPLLVKLTDFGIGQVISEEYLKGITRAGFTETILSDSSSSSGMGTQMYLAPELLAGKPASVRSDIYALGMVMYQLLVGDFTRPLTTDWTRDVADPLLREDLRNCFAGDPQERFAGAGQLARNLRALAERRAELARREAEQAALARAAYRKGIIRAAAVAGLVMALIAALAVYAFRQSNQARKQAQRAEREEQNKTRLLYAAEMNLARHALAAGNTRGATTLLERYVPQPGAEDMRGFEWRYLWQLKEGNSRLKLVVHTNELWLPTPVAFSPDGQTLAIGGTPAIQLRDAKSGGLLYSLPGNDSPVRSLTFSPNGRILASEDGKNALRLWDVATRTSIAVIPATGPGGENSLLFFPDNKRVASSRGKEVKIWDVATGQELASPPPHDSSIVCLAISRDGKMLAIGDIDGKVKLWNLQEQRQEALLRCHIGRVIAVAFSPDSATLAASTFGNETELWNVQNGTRIGSLSHFDQVYFTAFSPDGRYVATASGDQTAKLWDLSSRSLIKILQGHRKGLNSVSFSPDGQTVATGSGDGTIRLWDAANSVENVLRGHADAVSALAISLDGTQLVSGCNDGTIKIWSVSQQREVGQLPGHTNWIFAVAISPDGKTVASAGGVWNRFEPGELKLWDLTTGRSVALEGHTGCIFSANFSPDGRWLITGGNDHTLRVWDVATHRQVKRIPLEADEHAWKTFGVLSPDGRTLFSAVYGSASALWELPSGNPLAILHKKGFSTSAAFSPDGAILAVGHQNGRIELWDVLHRKLDAILLGHLSSVVSVAFSPDGRTLASGGFEGTAKLWNLTSHQEVLTLEGHRNSVNQVVFSPDGTLLVTASSDNTIRLWHAPPLSNSASISR